MWKRLDKVLLSRIGKSRLKEFSVECNPESFTIEKARACAESGVTRLTFGVQSLNARELSICGRAHSSEKALEVLSDTRLSGMFDSIGVDIIYGLPGQSMRTLEDTLTRVLSIQHVKHLSAYELTLGENTPFGRHRGILKLPADDDIIVDMYDLIGRRCAERGMRQYEVSNYALPGFESRHNAAYWSHSPYTGLGASAHSYVHPKRWSNVGDVNQYINKVYASSKPAPLKTDAVADDVPCHGAIDFEETLTPSDTAREMLFLGLRSAAGINVDSIAARTGVTINEERLQKYINDGLLKKSNAQYVPTSRGMLFADMMARSF